MSHVRIKNKPRKIKPIDEAWKWFSLFIKLRDTDWKGQGQCITCKQWLVMPGIQAHAGHFIHGKYKETYFCEKNVSLQCRSCNYFKDGARDVYALRLIEKYGEGIIQELHKLNKEKRWTKKELLAIAELYKHRVLDLQTTPDRKMGKEVLAL